MVKDTTWKNGMNFDFQICKNVEVQPCETLYDKVSANVMISVQKMGESESGQMVQG